MTLSRLVFIVTTTFVFMGCTTAKTQPVSGINQRPQLEHHQFIAEDGYHLPILRYWPTSEPKGVVIALHGFNDYSKSFEGMCEYYVARNMACIAYDQRGFGSTKMRGLWPEPGRLQKDLGVLVTLIRDENAELPIFLIGESMGGAVILTAMSESSLVLDKDVQGVILYAPAVWARSTQPWYQRALLWLLVRTLPDWRPTGKGLGIQATDNIDALRAMSSDGKVIKTTRIDTIHGLTNLMDAALLAATDVSSNLLVLYGEKDEVIPKTPTCQMLAKMKTVEQQITFKHYPEGYHMLTRDLQAERVFEDSLNWMFDIKLANYSGKAAQQLHAEILSKDASIRYCDEG